MIDHLINRSSFRTEGLSTLSSFTNDSGVHKESYYEHVRLCYSGKSEQYPVIRPATQRYVSKGLLVLIWRQSELFGQLRESTSDVYCGTTSNTSPLLGITT